MKAFFGGVVSVALVMAIMKYFGWYALPWAAGGAVVAGIAVFLATAAAMNPFRGL